MAIRVRRSQGRIIGLDGHPEIVPHDVGGLAGIRNVVPEFLLVPPHTQQLLQQAFAFRYMDGMCRFLDRDLGYTAQQDLFGLPYDFRLVLDAGTRATTFEDFRRWIEAGVAANGRRAVIIAHSMGGVMIKWFLTSHVSQAWIDRHIEHVVGVAVPYGGTPSALRATLCGDYYVPGFHHLFREEFAHNSGMILCFPNSFVYSPDEPHIVAGTNPITTASYGAMADAGVLPFEIYRDLWAPHAPALIGRVNAAYTAVIPSRQRTPSLIYMPSLHTYSDECETGDGDGIIPARSLAAFRGLYADEQRLDLPGASHTTALTDLRLFAYLRRLLLEKTLPIIRKDVLADRSNRGA